MGACTNSSYADQYGLPGTYAPTASYELLKSAVNVAENHNCTYHVGNILSSDTFYDDGNSLAAWQKMNVLAVEMESAALLYECRPCRKKMLCVSLQCRTVPLKEFQQPLKKGKQALQI